jgi:cytidylate kinase
MIKHMSGENVSGLIRQAEIFSSVSVDKNANVCYYIKGGQVFWEINVKINIPLEDFRNGSEKHLEREINRLNSEVLSN